MLRTLKFEGWTHHATFKQREFFQVQGSNEQEILAEVQRISTARGITDVTCVGLHNNRADWEAIFGKPDGQCAFGDDPCH